LDSDQKYSQVPNIGFKTLFYPDYSQRSLTFVNTLWRYLHVSPPFQSLSDLSTRLLTVYLRISHFRSGMTEFLDLIIWRCLDLTYSTMTVRRPIPDHGPSPSSRSCFVIFAFLKRDRRSAGIGLSALGSWVKKGGRRVGCHAGLTCREWYRQRHGKLVPRTRK
jgi:hypothetical protein